MRRSDCVCVRVDIFFAPSRGSRALLIESTAMSRIYIGRLSYQAREKDVERFFRGFGRIRDINLKNGFGFVEFDDSRDADDAVYELNGRELLGERVIVEHARGSSSGFGRRHSGFGGGGGSSSRYGGSDRGGDRGGGDKGGPGAPAWLAKYGPPTRTEYRIVVENISSRVSWQDLKDFMRSAGDITYADAHKQRVGEGVVEYATYEDMKNALRKLDGTELNGRKLKLTREQNNSYRKGKSRSRSHSRSRSRSRSSRSGSRSRSRSPRRSRNRSRERSRSHSRGRSRSRSNSRDRSRSKSHSPEAKNKSRSRSKSRSHSPAAQEKGSPQPNGSPRQSRSRSRSKSRSRSRSHSPVPRKSPGSDADMRSRSATPAEDQPHDE